MTNAKHTPGPWEWDEYYTGLDGANGQGVLIYSDYEGMSIHGETVAQAESNAHLIAAAPELLEALEKARQWMEDCGAQYRFPPEIDAAIAKAKGQTK